MTNEKIYAHSLEGLPTERWQPLEAHLAAVAERAAAFAQPFGSGEWARLLGGMSRGLTPVYRIECIGSGDGWTGLGCGDGEVR